MKLQIASLSNKGKVGEPSLSLIISPYRYKKLTWLTVQYSPVTTSVRITTRLIAFAVLVLVFCTACAVNNKSLGRIKDAGVLRIAIDPSFSPFEFINGENKLVGYDVDLAMKIADALGVKAQFVTTGYDALYDALTVNRADIIISALYPAPSRTQTFEYSTPYFNTGDVLIVADSAITSWKTLGGKRIACILGTAGHMTVLEWQKSISPPPVIIATGDPLTFTNALVVGELDAVLVDHVTALSATQNTLSVQILPEMISDEPYVIASRIEDRALIEAIDDILVQLKDDGTLLSLTEKWMHNHR